MKLKTLVAISFTLMLSQPVWADADALIKERQACMKATGGFMKAAVPVMKGETPYDKAAIDVAFTTYETACANWANFFGLDSQNGTVENSAKPEIWSDAAGFAEASASAMGAAMALKMAGDEAAFKTAFGGFGATCKSCHEKYRAPK